MASIMNIQKIVLSPALLLMGMNLAYALGDNFSKIGSIANTRHNLYMPQVPNRLWMDGYRNDYGEVCVYCHTPHVANTTVNLPLWNRTMKATTYTTYDQLGTSSLTQTVSQPGAASLGCLSCHDGTTAVDSIVNMPGSGRYSAAQTTTENTAFLDTWAASGKPGPTGKHSGMNYTHYSLPGGGCLNSCHTENGGMFGDFNGAGLGTDLTDDHPIGITYPAANGPGTDYKTPAGINGTTTYFDLDGNARLSNGDVRIYETKVECGSCHDAHGVPSAGPGSVFNPLFLRVSNAGSALCYTCHSK